MLLAGFEEEKNVTLYRADGDGIDFAVDSKGLS